MSEVEQNIIAPEQSIDSEKGEHGLDTVSSIVHSDTNSEHQNSEQNALSEEQHADNLSDSRGSTRDTGTVDDNTYYDRVQRPFVGRSMEEHHEEEPFEEDESPILTNKFLREMIKKEPRKYYRTAYLNDKLFLHYKGFHNIKNLEQFTDLKCLYFEGNGCRSMKGLEQNTMLRSLMMQENCIDSTEGLETLTQLRMLNMNDNMVTKISGLGGAIALDTIYLKNNRLGQCTDSDVDAIKGLLERPTLTCVDMQGNYLRDTAIFEEVLFKMPNLKCLYLMNNKVVQNMRNYRKTIISRIPTLLYLDDRPVFEDDRRKAEAFCRGGLEEEREEIKKIKKEKDDKHWANHEAFLLMMREAKEKNVHKEQAKTDKKETMKDMMAKAKAKKTAQEENKEFVEKLNEKADERFHEKQNNIEHSEKYDPNEKTEIELLNEENNRKGAEAFDKLVQEEKDKEGKVLVEDDKSPIQEDTESDHEDVPALEEPDREQLELEQLQKTKEMKQKEWLSSVMKEQEQSREMQAEQTDNQTETIADDQSESDKSNVELD